MRVSYLRVFNYASFKENGRKIEGKSFCEAVCLASAYIPVLGTITQVALLALTLIEDVKAKTLKDNAGIYPFLTLRIALTLVPPLLFAIDMITTIAQACINKKEPKTQARVYY